MKGAIAPPLQLMAIVAGLPGLINKIKINIM